MNELDYYVYCFSDYWSGTWAKGNAIDDNDDDITATGRLSPNERTSEHLIPVNWMHTTLLLSCCTTDDNATIPYPQNYLEGIN